MKIISKFKDYYDFVANKYGGGDPAIIYTRLKIKVGESNIINANTKDFQKMRFLQTPYFNSLYKDNTGLMPVSVTTKWLFVCGKRYLLIAYGANPLKVLNKVDHPEIWDYLFNKEYTGRDIGNWVVTVRGYNSRNVEDIMNYYLGKEDPFFEEISKQIGQPVFYADTSRYVHMQSFQFFVEPNVPILDKLGFGPFVAPEILYQELQHYITNVLRENPDIKPPTQVSNKDRIVQHGFDLKQSFRHRKS